MGRQGTGTFACARTIRSKHPASLAHKIHEPVRRQVLRIKSGPLILIDEVLEFLVRKPAAAPNIGLAVTDQNNSDGVLLRAQPASAHLQFFGTLNFHVLKTHN